MLSKFVRFSIVGGLCAILFFAVYYFCLQVVKLPAWLALLSTYTTCFGVGYTLQRNFAFRATATHHRSLWRYLVLHVFGMIFVYSATQWMEAVWRIGAVGASFSATALAGLASFVISLTWVFAEPIGRNNH
jgi:putative flippase GtrA